MTATGHPTRSRQLATFGPIATALLAIATSSPSPAAPDVTCTNHTITVDSLKRSYIKCVPASLDEPAGIVMLFHSATADASAYLKWTDWDQIAGRENVIVLSMNGCDWSGCNGGFWNTDSIWPWGWAEAHHINDQGFVAKVLDRVRADYTINPHRIFAAGYSNGGIFAYTLACDMADTFAAVGVTSGMLRDSSCHPSETVSVFHVHGTADALVPWNTADKSVDGWTSLQTWSGHDGCSPTTKVTSVDGATTCKRFTACDADRAVEYCTTAGADHNFSIHDNPRDWFAEKFRQYPK